MKTQEEKNQLKVAKANHKQGLKNKALYKKRRNELIMKIIESDIPNWGGIKLIVAKI